MKQTVVVCNNRREWNYFVDTLQWKLSKENKPYKATQNYIQDTEANTVYHYIPCGSDYTLYERIQGREFNDYILMCGVSNEQLEYLNSYMRGEK